MSSTTETPAQPTAPEGYVCINGIETELWSSKALDKEEALQKEAAECNPDEQDIYMYNDFFGYACVHIIEEQLLDLQDLIKAHGLSSKEVVYALEGLTFWMNSYPDWTMVDDGECFTALLRVFGAAWHTVASALQAESKLNTEYLPNASNLLLSVDALLRELNSIGGVCTKAGDSLRVMLARAELPYERKKEVIACPPDSEDEDGGENEESGYASELAEPPKKKAKKSAKAKVTDIAELANMSHEAAEKELHQNKQVSNYNFAGLLKSYKGKYCRPEMRYGLGFNITKWPEDIRKRHSLDNIDV